MDAAEIRATRMSLGMTQAQLARAAGVSQAFVARLEAGSADSSFSKVQGVLSSLEKMKMTRLPKGVGVQDIMSRGVIFIESRSDLKRAARIMKRRNISQLPVTERNRIVGAITEAEISHAITSKNPERLLVRDLMKLPMPMIDINSDMDLVVRLLDHSPAVLITRKGSVAGIVTRADMLKLIRR